MIINGRQNRKNINLYWGGPDRTTNAYPITPTTVYSAVVVGPVGPSGTGNGGAGVISIAGQDGVVTLSDIGLNNVNNTSDANKPVSIAQQAAFDLKANLASPTFTGTVSGITKAMVGLGNADNTADSVKPISGPTQIALDLKANLASPTFTGIVSGITKSMVGLSNVDNTADTAKPISSATQAALDAKANSASPTFTGTVSGITKSMVGLSNVDNKSSFTIRSEITSGNVTSALGFTPADAALIGANNGIATLDSAGKVPSAQLPSFVDDVLEYTNLAALPGTGSAGIIYVALDTGKIYRWSGSAYAEISPSPGSTDSVTEGSVNLYFTTPRAAAAAPVQTVAGRTGTVIITKADVNLGNVDNTADTAKPISSATQAALDAKANSASPTFTGTVSGITKSMVGLSNVDNTSDANKPISTATQTALDLKTDSSGQSIPKTISLIHGQGPSNWISSTTGGSAITLTAARLYAVIIEVRANYPIGSLGVAVSTGVATTVNLAIASIDATTGTPGTVLIATNGLSVSSAVPSYATVSPVTLPPGRYWGLIYSPGAAILRGLLMNTLESGGTGAAGFGEFSMKSLNRDITGGSRDFTVGQSALLNLTGGAYAVSNNATAPMLFWKP